MRVLIVQPTGDRMGHYGPYTTRLAQALAKHGHDVVVITNRLHPERFLPVGERHWFDISEVDGTKAFEHIDQHGGKGAEGRAVCD